MATNGIGDERYDDWPMKVVMNKKKSKNTKKKMKKQRKTKKDEEHEKNLNDE